MDSISFISKFSILVLVLVLRGVGGDILNEQTVVAAGGSLLVVENFPVEQKGSLQIFIPSVNNSLEP